MFYLLKKKFNSILLIVFLFFSLSNLTKFNDFNKNFEDDYDFLTLSDEKFNDNTNLEFLYDDISEKTRYQLVRKSTLNTEESTEHNKKETEKINLAEYNDGSITSDYFFDEKDSNLTLVPIFETIMFSGIPIPKAKPIPSAYETNKSVILSVKNKKSLKKNLEIFFDKEELDGIVERIKDDLDYKVKENIKLLFTSDQKIVEINAFVDNSDQLNLRRSWNDEFIYFHTKAPTETKVIRNRMKVKDTVTSTLKSANIPKIVLDEFIHQLSFSVDFQRDIKNGDIVEILYEGNFTKSNKIIGEPKLVYALMHLTDHKIELFRYKLSNGKFDYFDANGKSIRKSIMRTPLRGARLSSKYGMRKHPILGFSKMHKGVDFSAKRGTPIMAAGDGRVTFSGRNGSFGRFIEIRHLNNFSTRYAHLYKFNKGIKKGKIVKQGQIIGFVGTSGRSTGPHLHYEVKHKNRIINPLTLKLESSVNVDEDQMPNFYANISLTRERFLATSLQKTNTVGYSD